MNYSYTEHFIKHHKEYLLDTMMGPNALRMTEELTHSLSLPDTPRVLDLGCGCGLSSLLLAEKLGATVFAADLWISPTENARRFEQRGVDKQVFPLRVDVTQGLPFAENYFDLILCVDAYHYFGTTPEMLPFLLQFLKPGGQIAVAVPGLQQEFQEGTPPVLKEFLPDDHNFHSLSWWKGLWKQAPGARLEACQEMSQHEKAWAEWLESPNPYAQGDVRMMAAENGKYFNHVQMIATKTEE